MSESNQTFVPDDRFMRRIPPWHYNHDTGKVMIAAFRNSRCTKRMSVNWMKLSNVDDILRGHQGFGVASISANLCWSLSQEIERTSSEENPAHCEVVGDKPQSVQRRFRDMAEYLQHPSPTQNVSPDTAIQ